MTAVYVNGERVGLGRGVSVGVIVLGAAVAEGDNSIVGKGVALCVASCVGSTDAIVAKGEDSIIVVGVTSGVFVAAVLGAAAIGVGCMDGRTGGKGFCRP